MVGTALVTIAGVSWLLLLPLNLRGAASNPYIGLLAFVALPLAFFAGLALIPIGVALARRKGIAVSQISWRRAGLFFGLMTAANIVIASQVSYRAVEHMDTVQFCGQTCHVMKPEFTARGSLIGQRAPAHQTVACVACHVEPGATGWVKAKSAGTRQLVAILLNNFPRPIESAMESQRLASSAETCEQCHARAASTGTRLRVVAHFAADEKNTRTWTVLRMLVDRIHGAHLGPGVQIRYASQDRKRQTIPWVEYRNTQTGEARAYSSGGQAEAGQVFEMQCVDCHNRPAHTFELADHAVDQALADGRIAADLPFVKKTSMALLDKEYASEEQAAQNIPEGLGEFYRQNYPGASQPGVAKAGQELLSLYRRNVFPDLKVTWGTYVNNLGHTDAPGCFRCHDGSHAAPDGATVTQDCTACHQALAIDEASPEILKTLGIDIL